MIFSLPGTAHKTTAAAQTTARGGVELSHPLLSPPATLSSNQAQNGPEYPWSFMLSHEHRTARDGTRQQIVPVLASST